MAKNGFICYILHFEEMPNYCVSERIDYTISGKSASEGRGLVVILASSVY
uniref:Uncharacterized protein n=1 Tax=Rhizophora mucronata TaxID=61149 RepID=A0A2P2P2N8_RHIMU